MYDWKFVNASHKHFWTCFTVDQVKFEERINHCENIIAPNLHLQLR